MGPGDGHAAETRAGGGTWLTYRYRFSGEGTPESTGTVKAPSFLNAARRILARGLGATVGPAPAYLRLRAVGEQETLFRVDCTHAGDAAALRIDVVPSGTYQFAEVGPLATGGEPPAATV
ncbi:MAG TPA: hypothetical protein VGD56_08190 [Gemmatirosa sp.]